MKTNPVDVIVSRGTKSSAANTWIWYRGSGLCVCFSACIPCKSIQYPCFSNSNIQAAHLRETYTWPKVPILNSYQLAMVGWTEEEIAARQS